ncbi:MAG: methylmalonyl Co-A mutase-associated GTPase MeaB [Candidatus Nanopelagicales bacterium]
MSRWSTPELVDRALRREPRAFGRVLSLVEDAAPQLREIMVALAPHVGKAQVIGLTGAPGVGKSTTTSALISHYRQEGRIVGVLAVDPSSPFSGGALLGDRVRMQEHATDPGVFIRSMASRGHLGGLAWTTPQALRVMAAAGFDVILIETVGVGQSEVEIAQTADTSVVLLAPGMGDGIQAAKAGILEIGDLLVVNKADREGADATVRELRNMLRLSPVDAAGWRIPVLKTVASRNEGIAELADRLSDHAAWLAESGVGAARRRSRARVEISAIASASLQERFAAAGQGRLLDELAAAVAAGDRDPYGSAEELLAHAAG